MITCNIGKTIINCHNKQYNRDQLKEWSNKNILTCPVCGGTYEYCHGMVVPQYFRHKDKSIECEGLYNEPETEEHIRGKVLIYNWLKVLEDNGIVKNVQLESYIKATKQRPDLYFEQDGKQYVIEFQCTPIATEYLKRKELYKMADIKDIWILGLDKYDIYGERKIIEDNGCQLKLDVKNKEIYTNGELIRNSLEHGIIEFRTYRAFKLSDLTFKNKIVLCDKKLKPYVKRDNEMYEKIQRDNEIKQAQSKMNESIRKEALNILKEVRRHNVSVKNKMDSVLKYANKKRYTCRIEVFDSAGSGKYLYFFFDNSSVGCSQRVILDKKTGFSTFKNNGECSYIGSDSSNIIHFINNKVEALFREEC